MYVLPDLPYPHDALTPFLSGETLRTHHGKHHKAYVDKLNGLVVGSQLEGQPFEEIIRRTAGARDADAKSIFDNAAQHWNHSFFWNSLSPDGGEAGPGGALGAAIERDLGGAEVFAKEFGKQGGEHFGSGWAWLVLAGEKLQIFTTHDADTPVARGQTPLLCCDLWEHAYYLDYQNRRPDFLKAFTSQLANWRFAEANFAAARATDAMQRSAPDAAQA